MPYKPEDFQPINAVAIMWHGLMDANSVGAGTATQFYDKAKQKPGELVFATHGIGSVAHLTAALFAKNSGIKLNIVPFPGGNEAILGVAGGQAAATTTGLQRAMELQQEGRVKVLMVFAPTRDKLFPDVPTAKELGAGEIHARTWYGLLAPAGTPPAVVKKLNTALNEILTDPVTKDQFIKYGTVALILRRRKR